MDTSYEQYPEQSRTIFKNLKLIVLFLGQYIKRNFILNSHHDSYNELHDKYTKIKHHVANFLYKVQNNSNSLYDPPYSPRILSISDVFIRNIQIIRACKTGLFSLNLDEFPAIKDNRYAYEALIFELEKNKSLSYIDEFNSISKKYEIYVGDLVSSCQIELDVFKNVDDNNEDALSLIDYINDNLCYYPFADPKIIRNFIKIIDEKWSRARVLHNKEIIIPLSEGETLDDSYSGKIKRLFTGDKRFSIQKNSIKSRWLGLWLWDQKFNPYVDKLDEQTKVKMATAFYRGEDYIKKSNEYKRNKKDYQVDLTDSVRDRIEYNTKELLANATECINKMEIVSLNKTKKTAKND